MSSSIFGSCISKLGKFWLKLRTDHSGKFAPRKINSLCGTYVCWSCHAQLIARLPIIKARINCFLRPKFCMMAQETYSWGTVYWSSQASQTAEEPSEAGMGFCLYSGCLGDTVRRVFWKFDEFLVTSIFNSSNSYWTSITLLESKHSSKLNSSMLDSSNFPFVKIPGVRGSEDSDSLLQKGLVSKRGLFPL